MGVAVRVKKKRVRLNHYVVGQYIRVIRPDNIVVSTNTYYQGIDKETGCPKIKVPGDKTEKLLPVGWRIEAIEPLGGKAEL
jgi:hypothetical protein